MKKPHDFELASLKLFQNRTTMQMFLWRPKTRKSQRKTEQKKGVHYHYCNITFGQFQWKEKQVLVQVRADSFPGK